MVVWLIVRPTYVIVISGVLLLLTQHTVHERCNISYTYTPKVSLMTMHLSYAPTQLCNRENQTRTLHIWARRSPLWSPIDQRVLHLCTKKTNVSLIDVTIIILPTASAARVLYHMHALDKRLAINYFGQHYFKKNSLDSLVYASRWLWRTIYTRWVHWVIDRGYAKHVNRPLSVNIYIILFIV